MAKAQRVGTSGVMTLRLSSLKAEEAESGTTSDIRTELDNHADTCVVGDNTALVINDFERPIRVYGYNGKVADPICKLVSAVVAYDHATTGDVYMIVIHQAVLVPGMKVNLFGQMQVKDNDVIVNDEPKYMALTPTDNTHAITLKDKEGEIALRIPLSLHGVTSYFTTRKPTQEEYDKTELSSILDLTYESPDWDPTSTRFQEQEDAMVDSSGNLKDVDGGNLAYVHALQTSAVDHTEPDSDSEFGVALESWKQQRPTAAEKRVACCALATGKPGTKIDARKLAKNWCISEAAAKRTLEATTQKGLQTILHVTLSRRFWTNDR